MANKESIAKKKTGRCFNKAVVRTNWEHETNKHMKQDDVTRTHRQSRV